MSEHRIALRQYHHPDIRVRVHDSLDIQAAGLVEHLVEMVRSGSNFAPDQTVQVGWVILRMAEDARGDLIVTEPDFKSMPIEWREGADRCIRFLAIQRAVCKEVGVEPDFASLRQACSAPNQLPQPDRFSLVREHAEGAHSGWLFQSHTAEDDDLRLVSLYEVVLANPSLIAFLALPVGSAVERGGTSLRVTSGGRSISADESPLLAQLEQHGWFGDVLSA